ncbi:MAG TPA: hypothetical protein VFE43_09180 [Candidatus Binataceae bacterium]|nr:hypothetical protein [Candidatus Binataceae bacterium]
MLGSKRRRRSASGEAARGGKEALGRRRLVPEEEEEDDEMVEQRPADRRHHAVIEHFVEIDKPWNPGAMLGECEGNGAPDAAFADDALSQASQVVDFAPRNPWGSAPLNRLLCLDFSPVHPV